MKMKDTVWTGCAIGLLAPALPGALVWFLMQRMEALRGADLLLIACVAVNAVLLKYFFKQHKERTAQGVLSVTFLWAFAFFIYKTF